MGRFMKWIRAWFWSRVRDNENWAQTLVRVIGNLFRIALTLAALAAGTVAMSSYLSNQQHRQRQEETRFISVVASMQTEQNDNGCAEMFPLALFVRNDSTRALISMDIALSARRPGTSTNALQYWDRQVHWDHIIPPGYSMTMCYALPESAPPSAIYSADPISYTVVLRPSEQWMLDETRAAKSTWQIVHP